MKKTYSITGKLIHAITSQPVEGLRIEAWDKDLLVNFSSRVSQSGNVSGMG